MDNLKFDQNNNQEEAISIDLIKQKIAKSGNIKQKTAKILALNLGQIILKYKKEIVI